MTPSTLVILLAHAEHQRDQALVRRGQADQALSQAQQQQARLIADQRRHENRWFAVGRQQPVAAPLLQVHQAWSRRQREAIDQQAAQVDQARQTLLKCQADALDAERHAATLTRLHQHRAETHRLQQQRQSQRQSQRQADERAARAPCTRFVALFGTSPCGAFPNNRAP